MGGLEELRGGIGEMRTEHERRGGAVRGEAAQEEPRGLRGIARVSHPGFFGQGNRVEPVEQRTPHRADDAHLWKMHVRVDESRQNEPATPVHGDGIRMRVSHGRVVVAHATMRPSRTRRPPSSKQMSDCGSPVSNEKGFTGVWTIVARKSSA